MKAQLTLAAVGMVVVGSAPCPPGASMFGIQSGVNCSLVASPGVDLATLQSRVIDPPSQLTVQEQAEQDNKITEAETTINTIITCIIVLTAILGTVLLVLGAFLCRRAHVDSVKLARASSPHVEWAPQQPTILTNTSAASTTKA